jgi:hypothetical protein
VPQPTSPAIIVGSVAASATTGALVAMGHRAGSGGLAFAAIGAVLFQRSANSSAAGLVFTGLVLHVMAMFLWSFIFIWVCTRVAEGSTSRRFAAAIAVGTGQFALSWLVAWSTGKGLASTLPLGDLLAFSLVLSLALALGIRIAFSAREPDASLSHRGPPQL